MAHRRPARTAQARPALSAAAPTGSAAPPSGAPCRALAHGAAAAPGCPGTPGAAGRGTPGRAQQHGAAAGEAAARGTPGDVVSTPRHPAVEPSSWTAVPRIPRAQRRGGAAGRGGGAGVAGAGSPEARGAGAAWPGGSAAPRGRWWDRSPLGDGRPALSSCLLPLVRVRGCLPAGPRRCPHSAAGRQALEHREREPRGEWTLPHGLILSATFVGLGFPSRAVMSVTDSRFSKEEKNFLSLLPLRLVLRFFPASNKPGRVFPGADTQRLYHSLPLLMVSWCCCEAQVSCSRRNSPGNCPCMNRWVWAAASSSPTSLLFPPSSVSLCFPAPDQINQCFEILE